MLEIEQLTYQTGNKRLLENISLSLKPGQVWGVVGLNGAGKSTLLKNLAGIWRPTSGKLLWQGSPLIDQDRRKTSRHITLVPQNPHICFNYTVAEFVAMGRYPHDKWLRTRDEVTQTLERVDAAHLQTEVMTHLSHGEQQRVYIARSLISQCPIILLDEPTASLDIAHQILIWEILRDLASEDKIIVVSIHDLYAAKKFCDKIILLHRGRCIASGSFDTTITDRRLKEIFGVSALH